MGDVVNLAKTLQEQMNTAVFMKGTHVPFTSQGDVAQQRRD